MRKFLQAAGATRAGRFAVHLFQRYSGHDVAQQGAALAYYLLFSLFPLLILVSSLIGQLELDISGILTTLAPILPADVLALTESYLTYVSENVSEAMLYFSVVFSVYFPMRATDCLMRAVRRAYRLPPPKSRIRYGFKVFFYTVLLLFSIALTLLFASLGRDAAAAMGSALRLPEWFAELWEVVRFLALGLIILAALGTLYAVAQDERRSARAILPGAVLSTLAWILLSILYSFYTEYISDYSVIYGALGTVVVLLIWLYLTALTLMIGAEINDTLLCLPGNRKTRWTN